MPLENAVFKPRLDAVPPVDADSEAKENAAKEAARKIADGVPPLWNRVPPTPPKEPAGSAPNIGNLSHGITNSPLGASDSQKTRRELTAELEEPVAVSSRPSSPPRDEVRERLSTMFERSRPADRKRTTVSVLGLDAPQSRDSGRDSSASGPTLISGPSFLGLDSDPPSADYLLEEEEPGHGRAWLVVTVIVVLAVLVGLQWRTEVQAQARRVAAIVKARMQPPAVKTEETSATSSDVKSPPADAASNAPSAGTTPPAAAPQSATAKAGDDQNPVKGAAPEQPSSVPAAAPQPGKDAPVSEGAKSEKAMGPNNDAPAVANKQPPLAEQPLAVKSAPTKDRA
ncbi:MAG: hypothetical protein ACXVJT_12860, partial [Thermoanaerobaculia bacterium]